MARKLVLHFGYDELLSEARVMVLEDAGYDAIATTVPATAVRLLRSKPVALVVACHSVPPDELASVLRKMKLAKPRVPILVVHLGGLVHEQRSEADGFIDGLRGPEHLLSRVAICISNGHTVAAAS